MDRETARKQLCIIEHKKVILSVGSLIPLKGFHTIIDALPDLLSRDGDIELHIVGEGPYRSALAKRAAARGVSGHVVFAGQRPNSELSKWYNAADVFCLASFREGWPNVVMESLACGTPVVATRVYGTPEILVSPDLGILVDPTPESIGAGLRDALQTNWNRPKIRAHMETHTWRNIAGKIRTVFQEILDRDSSEGWRNRRNPNELNLRKGKDPCP